MSPCSLVNGPDRTPALARVASPLPADLFDAIVALTTAAVVADVRATLTVDSATGHNRTSGNVTNLAGKRAGKSSRVRRIRVPRASDTPGVLSSGRL